MKNAKYFAWGLVALFAAGVIGEWAYGYYQAEAHETSGSVTVLGMALLSLLSLSVFAATVITVRQGRGSEIYIPSAHWGVAAVGATVALVFWPAIVVPLGLLGYDLMFGHRRPAETRIEG